jgi:hypothetical protein
MELISTFLFAIALFLGGGFLAGVRVAFVLFIVCFGIVGIRCLTKGLPES